MFWNRYFAPSIMVMLVTVALHWIASLQGYYWTVWWYDVMMHLLGGLWTFMFGLWAFSASPRLAKYVSVRNMLFFVLIVGLLWEVHEIYFKFASLEHPEYWVDTPQDIVFDMLGAAFGAFLYRKSITNTK